MDNVRLKDATRNIGEDQGFLNVSIRDEIQVFPGRGHVRVMVTQWQPTEQERLALIQGAPITFEMWGFNWPPVLMYVGEPVKDTVGNG